MLLHKNEPPCIMYASLIWVHVFPTAFFLTPPPLPSPGVGHRVSSKAYCPPAPGAILGEADISAFVEGDDVLADPNPPENNEE